MNNITTASAPTEILGELRKLASNRLNDKTEVVETSPPIDAGSLFSQSVKWRKYEHVVAVFADLKGSTKLAAEGMWDKSTASIYDAAIEPMCKIFDDFGGDYISVQGDGGFGLFTGELAIERAVCAAVTLQTFSHLHLAPLIRERWSESANPPETGFKTGIAASTLLGRKVGIPRTDHSAPVWAGRAVNYAAKCSQQVGAHRILVTRPIYEAVSANDYLAISCGCIDGRRGDSYSPLWEAHTIDYVGEKDSAGALLNSTWCQSHGDDYCAAALAGESRREDVKDVRARLTAERRAS